jgi:hypothetical protein
MAVRILPNRTLDHPAVAPTTAPPAIRPPVERRRVLTAVGVPVLVFVMMRVVFSLATGTGLTDATPETWARYDSGHYRTIATEGYYVEPCAARGEVDITPTCSNAAWYPGYPLVSRALSLVGMSWGTAAILIAQLATLGILLLIWNGFLHARVTVRNVALMVLAGFFPGTVYFLAAFPLSVLVLLMLWQIRLFRQHRWYGGAVVGMLASLTYPVTLVLGPAAAAWVYLADQSPFRRQRLTRAGVVGAIITSGTFVVFIAHQIVLGRWDASIEQQRWFGAAVHNPARQFWDVVVARDTYMQVIGVEHGLTKILAAQTLLVAVMVLTVVGLALWKRAGRTIDDVGLTLLIVAMWLLPLVNNIDTGLYRRESALLPLVVLLVRAPTWMVTGFALAAVPLWALMADRFYHHVLI